MVPSWRWSAAALISAACTLDSGGGGQGSASASVGGSTGQDTFAPVTGSDSSDASTSGPATSSTTDASSDGGSATITGASCPPGWHKPGWGRRVRIEIDNSAGEVDLPDYRLPIRLDLSAPELAGVAEDGRDLRFVDDAGGDLPFELEAWQPGEAAWLWVRIPGLDAHGANQQLWLYLANPGADPPPAGTDVWDGYDAVWHLSETATTLVHSSAAPPVTGTSTGTLDATGAFAGAREFVSADVSRIDFGAESEALFSGWNQFSFSLWIFPTNPRPDSTSHEAFSRGGSLYNGRMWHEGWQDPDVGLFQIDIAIDSGHTFWRRFSVKHAQWNHLVYDFDGQTLRLVHDGQLVDEVAAAPGGLYDAPAAMTLGGYFAFDVVLDEVRISAQSRDPAWYEAEHRLLTQSLVSLGYAEDCD